MRREQFSDEYLDYRVRLAKEIAGTTLPYLVAAVADDEQIPLFDKCEQSAFVKRTLPGVAIVYITEDSAIGYAAMHQFHFTFEGEVRYIRSPSVDSELPEPIGINDIESIGRSEEALNELAYISNRLLNSGLAEKYVPYDQWW